MRGRAWRRCRIAASSARWSRPRRIVGTSRRPHGALLGDGSAWIWNLHAKWFKDLTPVVDFVHALTYLYVTATVLAPGVVERWQWYVA